MRTLLFDVRHALRVFRRAPSFALAVVAVVALGVGANTAIFSIVNAVLLRPLPFDDADRMVRLFHTPPQTSFPGIPRFSVSPGNFLDWKRDSRSFEGMAAYNARGVALTGSGEPELVIAGRMGEGFFEITRAHPTLGRGFLAEEHAAGRNHVVVLSEGFWKKHLGGSPDAVGRTLTLDGESYTIVGVMPARFSVQAWGATSFPLWIPLTWDDKERAIRENHNYAVIARLNPGVTLEQAKSELDVISARLAQQFPAENAGWGATGIPLQELLVGDIRRSLVMLLAAVTLVLLVACANVGNLILARALGRRKEIAIRAALGAGRRRVFQHLIVEALVLAFAGGAAGLLLAKIGIDAGGSLLAEQLPRVEETTVDTRVLLFALAASILTGVLAGALPALRAGRTDLNDALKEGGRSDSAGAGGYTRRALIVCEIALSVVLLMGAGVMLRSLEALRQSDAGFNPHNVLTMELSLPDTRYATPTQRAAFSDALLERLRALPGVESASFTDTLPATGGGSTQPMVIEGRAELSSREQPTVSVRRAVPTYLRTMGIQLLRGRDFSSGDDNALLVSAKAAKLLWGDADPVGRRATLPLMSRTTQMLVVGIVADVKEQRTDDAVPTVYYYKKELLDFGGMVIAMRTSADPMTIARPAVAAVRALDAALPVENVRSMDNLLEESLASQRFTTLLLEIFAAVAMLLASVGIYSVLSYVVRGRSREIGIRTALGAGTSDVLRMVVVEGMKPTLVGIAVGVVCALGSAHLMTTMVYGVSASDPLTLVSVSVVLCVVALVASVLPAWRAARVNPLTALRD
jgi:predicted permease